MLARSMRHRQVLPAQQNVMLSGLFPDTYCQLRLESLRLGPQVNGQAVHLETRESPIFKERKTLHQGAACKLDATLHTATVLALVCSGPAVMQLATKLTCHYTNH